MEEQTAHDVKSICDEVLKRMENDGRTFEKSEIIAIYNTLERLRDTSRLDAFLEAMNSEGARLVFTSDDKLLVQKVFRKRFYGRVLTIFDPDTLFTSESVESSWSFKEKAECHKFWAQMFVKENDCLLRSKPKESRFPMDLSAVYLIKRLDPAGLLDIARHIVKNADLALDENNTLDSRLNAAYQLGVEVSQFSVLKKYGTTQSKVAKKERQKEINELIAILARKDEPAKDLWNEFLGLLDANNLKPVESVDTHECSYINENGKRRKIKFSTFSNKISKARKG